MSVSYLAFTYAFGNRILSLRVPLFVVRHQNLYLRLILTLRCPSRYTRFRNFVWVHTSGTPRFSECPHFFRGLEDRDFLNVTPTSRQQMPVYYTASSTSYLPPFNDVHVVYIHQCLSSRLSGYAGRELQPPNFFL